MTDYAFTEVFSLVLHSAGFSETSDSNDRYNSNQQNPPPSPVIVPRFRHTPADPSTAIKLPPTPTHLDDTPAPLPRDYAPSRPGALTPGAPQPPTDPLAALRATLQRSAAPAALLSAALVTLCLIAWFPASTLWIAVLALSFYASVRIFSRGGAPAPTSTPSTTSAAASQALKPLPAQASAAGVTAPAPEVRVEVREVVRVEPDPRVPELEARLQRAESAAELVRQEQAAVLRLEAEKQSFKARLRMLESEAAVRTEELEKVGRGVFFSRPYSSLSPY